MTPVVLGLLCALIVAIAAAFYFWVLRRRQDESIEGVRSLNAMRWREFAGVVLEMMLRRGYLAAEAHPLGSGDQSDILLKRDGVLYVLSCKHGSAYRLGAQAVDELANALRMNDAAGGLLVTPGVFAPDAYPHAKPQRIELIDGKAIWPEAAPLMSEAVQSQVRNYAAARAKRGLGLGLAAALVAGIAVALLVPRAGDNEAPAVAAETAAPAPSAAKAESSPSPAAPVSAAIPTAEQSEQRRSDVAGAIAALPGVERAIWSTQSTLALDIGNERPDLWKGVCGILDRYEELRATRVQINPPPGSGAPVRFRQCHTY
ncbi:restriction endonuclease [Luteimonas gilva]|uniref:Restriction endonuclease n=1 Tax=Luteimonas gilva TaxID=2572684 RepID=A0A4U5JU81_9GAMM|nr:restriction endonuclease [Luteimonas gilva]TKR33392.1 restriction endonuclease [Luteimonas gilva]